LEDKINFCVISRASPQLLYKISNKRKWSIKLLSITEDSDFFKDFKTEPNFSSINVFVKNKNEILRDYFTGNICPSSIHFNLFNPVWNLFSIFLDKEWQPKFQFPNYALTKN
jgi:hypothetical protein